MSKEIHYIIKIILVLFYLIVICYLNLPFFNIIFDNERNVFFYELYALYCIAILVIIRRYVRKFILRK